MNKKVSRIIDDLKSEKLRNNKQAVIFFVCLSIAAILWFLNSMEKDYNTALSYPVKYVNPPDNLFLSNNPPQKLELNVQLHGFTLLRHKLSLSVSPVIIDLKTITRNAEKQNNIYKIPSETLINKINPQISKEISINSISPQEIEFQFDSLKSKSVPVTHKADFTFRPQYFLNGNVSLKPDSVLITGPSAIIDTIKMLYTESKIFSELNKNLERHLSVNNPKNTKVTPEKVSIQIPVERFTEKELTIQIHTVNLEEGVNLKLFPNRIKLTVMVSLSEYEKVTPEDFFATVDYNDTADGKNRLQVSAGTEKQYLQILRTSPDYIEYLIETE